ncbi:NAD(P)-binding protein [Punctularia strigosozonata HHB-11173 SS5]|uniref:NAD(P)-binding protein n=1 Tax=Punctularia strigosozonata (strain HHB-11173) TaxID=741275 RepID=UPI0004416BD6|nr:NAD(P)-binding protein [Punctularia strigosozonata HHB-11173 SS5]EIN05894.1 NAD(P)-binding protein [Punctularia strigosozonata HHB-11173 SS5]
MVSKVAVTGGTGATLGLPVVEQLVAAKFDVIVLSRTDTPSGIPAGVTARRVDYDSVASLTAALRDVDGVVSTVGGGALSGQKKIIDAAVAAGVQRFLPSEFGNDLQQPAVRALPVYASKVEVQEYLEKASATSSLTYAVVNCGPFLNCGIYTGFLLGSMKERKVEIYEGGAKKLSATTLATVGKGVVGVLRHLEETKNRTVYFHDAAISQSQIVDIAKELAPGEE